MNKAEVNRHTPSENFWWAGLHNVVVHPLMWLFRYPKWLCRFHDWTAEKAWSKEAK